MRLREAIAIAAILIGCSRATTEGDGPSGTRTLVAVPDPEPTWVHPVGGPMRIQDAAFDNQGRGVAVGFDGYIYYWDGKAWKTLPRVARDHLAAVIHSGAFWIAVGNNGSLFRSNDGQSWSSVPRITDASLATVDAVGNTVLVAGNQG